MNYGLKTKRKIKMKTQNRSLPSITSYGNYSSDNYGFHTQKVTLKNISIYYSYETIVAYEDIKDGLVCCKNQWGVTTGKHLNWIEPNKKLRKSSEEFEKLLNEALDRHNI
jgi:hypothetical protein